MNIYDNRLVVRADMSVAIIQPSRRGNVMERQREEYFRMWIEAQKAHDRLVESLRAITPYVHDGLNE